MKWRARFRRAAGERAGRTARRPAARHQGFVLHRRRAHDGVLAHSGKFRSALRIDRHLESVARRRRHARQAQLRRIRHGLVERDLAFRPGGVAMAAARRRHKARARRLLGRVGGGGGGAFVRRRHRHRYRRLDPTAGGVLRHRRIEAHLRPLLALGHRRVRVVARPGRAVRAHRARLRDLAALDGGAGPERYDLRRSAGTGLRESRRRLR